MIASDASKKAMEINYLVKHRQDRSIYWNYERFRNCKPWFLVLSIDTSSIYGINQVYKSLQYKAFNCYVLRVHATTTCRRCPYWNNWQTLIFTVLDIFVYHARGLLVFFGQELQGVKFELAQKNVAPNVQKCTKPKRQLGQICQALKRLLIFFWIRA